MTAPRTGRTLYYIVLVIVFVAGISTSTIVFFGPTVFEHFDSSSKTPNDDSAKKLSVSVDRSENSSESSTHATIPLVSSLVEIVGSSGPFERNMALLNVLEHAEVKQVLELLEQSRHRGSSVRVRTQAVILQKLVRFSPLRALSEALKFDQSRSNFLLTALFREWAHLSLDEAISQAAILEGESKRAALKGILLERNDLSDTKRREIAQHLGNEQLSINLINTEKLRESVGAPEKLWDEIVEEAQNDPEQIELLVQIAQIWVEKEGLEALDQIMESLENSRTRTWVTTSVLREVAQSNAVATLEYALTLDDPSYTYKFTVVDEWARYDPKSARDTIASTVDEGWREILLKQLVKSWAVFHPSELLVDFESIPRDLVELGIETAISQIATNSPQEAAKIVSTMEETGRHSFKMDAARTVIYHWLSRDIDATLDWVLNDPDLKDQRSELSIFVSLSLVEHDAERAMQFALQQPIGENESGPEAWVVGEVARIDIDEALALLPKVRDGQAKIQAYRFIGHELIGQGYTDKALNLLKQVPEYAKQSYLGSIIGDWTYRDPKGLVESLQNIASKEIAVSAALNLLLNDPWDERLNPEENKSLRDFLTEEDTKLLEKRKLSLRYPVIPFFITN